jgi:RHS repeat-associated protein
MDGTADNNHIKVGGSTTSVSYDARGNLTNWNAESTSFDSLDRLYRNQNGSGDHVFIHNGAGERLLKFPADFTVLRREMARYIAEANIIARGWTLPLCDGGNPSPFTDVPCSDPDARYVKLAYLEGITAGCGGTNYCPDTAITRAQMAVFMVKGYRGASYVPQACPPAVNPFTDFTCSGPYSAFAPFIIQLYNDGVTAGCNDPPLQFCPGSSIGEWETLVWLAKGGTPGSPFWPTYHPVPRGSTYTLRDEQNRVATEIAGGLTGSSTATLSVARDNVFLGGLLVASNAASAWSFSASDHLGSPRAVWNSSGTKTEDHKYWPYGEDTSATLNQHIAFQGMERNDAVPIYYDHARSQQFNLGRFLTTDILRGEPEDPQSWNRYSFVRSNPLRFTDPDGKDFKSFLLGAANAIGTNFVPGVRGDSSDADFRMGQSVGDAISIPLGAAEVLLGGAIFDAGLLLDATGVGIPAGLALNAAGAALAAQGTLGSASGAIHLLEKSGSEKTRGLEKQVEKHEQKLADYKRNPDAHDNQGQLKGKSCEARERVITSRIQKLVRRINNFKDPITNKTKDFVDK